MNRPECYEAAMRFLGGSEEDEIRAYVEDLESKVKNFLAVLDDEYPDDRGSVIARALSKKWGIPL